MHSILVGTRRLTVDTQTTGSHITQRIGRGRFGISLLLMDKKRILPCSSKYVFETISGLYWLGSLILYLWA